MNLIAVLDREIDNLCIEATLLALFARLYPFEFPLDTRMATEIIAISQKTEQLSHALSRSTNGDYSMIGIGELTQQICTTLGDAPCYTKESTNAIISVYAAGFYPELQQFGMIDYSENYPECCRGLLCSLFDLIISSVLWWHTNPASSGFSAVQTIASFEIIWSALTAMCEKNVMFPHDENYVSNAVRRWLASDRVSDELLIGSNNTKKTNEVVSSLQFVLT